VAACLGLALFQAFAVPPAGVLVGLWLGLGAAFYFTLLAPRARVADASALALDPDLVRLRGRSPLVLVPIANPASAPSLVAVANSLVTPMVGRVLLLSVIRPPDGEGPADRTLPQLRDAEAVLGEALSASFARQLAPEALITISDEPWAEIARVSRLHGCESVLLGLGRLEGGVLRPRLEELIGSVDSDVVIARVASDWHPDRVRRILVPVGGRDDQSKLRARLLGSLHRAGERTITYLRVMRPGDSADDVRRAERGLARLARDEAPVPSEARIVRGDDPAAGIAEHAADHDLVVLGVQRESRRRKTLGPVVLRIARETDRPLILISRRG
jgi:hypothetical protein